MIEPFVDYIYKNPDWLVIDVGAQIGNSHFLKNTLNST